MRLAPQLGQIPRRSLKAPTFGATESHQTLVMTILTAYTQETILQTATLEVIVEFPLHIQGKRAALPLQVSQELLVILINDLVEKRFLRLVALIPWRALTRGNPCRTSVARHIVQSFACCFYAQSAGRTS
jgi:hypothetical protein